MAEDHPLQKTGVTMVMILFILLFFTMVSIPFFIALKELFIPKDDKPLYIDMFYSKDPLYFGRAFRKMVREKIEAKSLPLGSTIIEFSKPEEVEILENKSFPENSVQNCICYISGNLDTGNKTMLKRDIYVKGSSTIGERNVLRTLFGEGEIWLGAHCHISRWVCSATDIAVAGNANLGRSISCLGKLELAEGCKFQSLFARPVITGAETAVENPSHRHRMPVPLVSAYPKKIHVDTKMTWRIIKKHVSINCRDANVILTPAQKILLGTESTKSCCDTEPGMGACNEAFWKVTRNRVTLVPGSHIKTNFVARKELHIQENCKIYSTLKGYKDVIIDKNVEVHGDIFAEGDIYIGENCIIMGNVFSQSRVFIGNGVWISRPEEIKSVIGKKKIEIGNYVVIYGYLLSEGEGIVQW